MHRRCLLTSNSEFPTPHRHSVTEDACYFAISSVAVDSLDPGKKRNS